MAPIEKRERDVGSGTPLAKKVGAKPGARALVVGAPDDAPELFGEGVQVLRRAADGLDAIVLFVTERRVLERRLPQLRERLAPTRVLWGARPEKGPGGGGRSCGSGSPRRGCCGSPGRRRPRAWPPT